MVPEGQGESSQALRGWAAQAAEGTGDLMGSEGTGRLSNAGRAELDLAGSRGTDGHSRPPRGPGG